MIRRGDIYWITNDGAIGCEQRGNRPAVVISNNLCNYHSPTIHVVPLTTRKKKYMPTHIFLRSRTSTALCEQLEVVDKERLGKFEGRTTEQEMRAIEHGVKIQLGLEEI